MDNELTKMIDKLVHERVFSMEGLEAVKELRDRCTKFEEELTQARQRNGELREKIVELSGERDVLAKRVKEREEQLKELREREGKIVEHEKSAAVSKAESAAYKYALDVVFKPNTVREQISKTVPVVRAYTGGGDYVEDRFTGETITREEG